MQLQEIQVSEEKMSEEGELKKRIKQLIDLYPVVLTGTTQLKPEDKPMIVRYVPDNVKEIICYQILDEAKQEFYKVTELPHDEQASKYRLLIKKWFGKVTVI